MTPLATLLIGCEKLVSLKSLLAWAMWNEGEAKPNSILG